MQSTRPKHHANSSRSLFQNPWMAAESTAAPPPGSSYPTPRKSTLNSNYWPVFPSSFELPTLERVRASAFTSNPHPPVKVVKPDWGKRSTSTSTASEPSLKATWLGHAVRPQVAPILAFTLMPCSHTPRVTSSSSRVLRPAHKTNPLASCSTPSSQSALARLLGWESDAACLLLAQ